MTQVDQTRKPPYAVPWSTFINFMDKLSQEGVPNRIDPTLMRQMSGQMQSYMTGLLKFFELIDEQRYVRKDVLEPLVDPGTRKEAVADLLRKHYPEVVQLGETNATIGELDEAVAKLDVQGDPKRKATTFFLNAAAFADLPTSPLWKGPKTPARQTANKKRKVKPSTPIVPKKETSIGGGDTFRVDLHSGGHVTVIVDIPFWDLDDEDQEFVLDIKRKVRGYDRQPANPPKTPEPEAQETPSEAGVIS